METILIVEDETTHREALVASLQKKGFRALSASNGEEGLSLARAERPALIVLDIFLPHMNGLEMLRKLRGEPGGESIRVIVLTAFDSESYRNQAEELGVSHFFVKTDWRLSDLAEKIVQIVEEKIQPL